MLALLRLVHIASEGRGASAWSLWTLRKERFALGRCSSCCASTHPCDCEQPNSRDPRAMKRLVERVNAGYGSQEEVFGDAVEQGFKVKCQTHCASHFYTKNSPLMIIHVYRIPFLKSLKDDRRPQMLLLREGHVRYDLLHSADDLVSLTSCHRRMR